MRNQIIRCFIGTDFRLGHEGLTTLCAKNRINPNTLESGQFIVFLNGAKNKIKVLTAGQILVYYRHPKGHRIHLNALAAIPRAFQGGRFSYDDALKIVLDEELGRKRSA